MSSSEEDDDTKFLFGAVNTALRGGDSPGVDNSPKNGTYVRTYVRIDIVFICFV